MYIDYVQKGSAMETTTFSEFRRNAKRYMDLVQKGRKVRILRYGKPVAVLVPAGGEKEILSWRKPGLRLSIKGSSLAGEVLNERENA